MRDKITLVGAGLAGSLLSMYVAKRGLQVDMYERRPDMRRVQIEAGRSINLALSTRGIHALKDVGLQEKIMTIAIPMKGRMIHSVDGELTFQRYGKDDTEVIYATSRADLNKELMTEAEAYGNVRIRFGQRCTGMNLETSELMLCDEYTGKEKLIQAGIVIGTDGSASAIRLEMQKIGRFNLSQSYLEYGYKELLIPSGSKGEFLLEKHALHIWPRRTFMLIALPNIDGSFTCTFFFPFEGENSFESLDNKDKVLEFFRQQFPDAVALMPTLLDDYFLNPTGSMVTIKCTPWFVSNKVALLGDAAHAIVPFFGQGMNCAFEDCTYLDECIARHGSDWENVFREYETLRKVNTDAIADLALENFVEMRDHVVNPKFLLKKEVEQALQARYPNRFIPKYSMVTFNRTPYAVAREKGRMQDTILAQLCESIDNVESIDWKRADSLLQSYEQ
jgi:kynurenine 3-monooxygenase